MSAGPDNFDGAAAVLRRATGDMKAFIEALAVRLEAALPGRVEIERRRDGLFSGKSHVAKIAVGFETCLLCLTSDKGRLHATRAKVVRGVTINTEDVGLPLWLDEVARHTSSLGGDASAAHGVLHDFLLS